MATLPDHGCINVSARTGWPDVSTLPLGVIAKLASNNCLSAAAHVCLSSYSCSGHSSDLNIGTPVATQPHHWLCWVSARTGWPSVGILPLSMTAMFVSVWQHVELSNQLFLLWLKHWYSSSFTARPWLFQCQCQDWLAWCEYTATGCDSKAGMQLLSPCGSTYMGLSSYTLSSQTGHLNIGVPVAIVPD